MNVKLLRTTQEVHELLPTIMAKPSWGFDTETTGLDPLTDKVLMAQLGNMHEQFVIDTRTASLEPLRPFFESTEHKKVAHNMAFDWKMIKANYKIEIENSRDTILAEYLLFSCRSHKSSVRIWRGMDSSTSGFSSAMCCHAFARWSWRATTSMPRAGKSSWS